MAKKRPFSEFVQYARAQAPGWRPDPSLSDEEIAREYFDWLIQNRPADAQRAVDLFDLGGSSFTAFGKGLIRGAIPFADRVGFLQPKYGEKFSEGWGTAGEFGGLIGSSLV